MKDIIFKTLMLKGEAGSTIVSMEKTGHSGTTDTYTITFDDGSTTDIQIENLSSVDSIELTSQTDTEDTYTVTLADGSTQSFSVLNHNADIEAIKSTMGYVTPEMFGAVGDGVTDDTVAIQTAIDTRHPVYFTKLYKTTAPLTLYSGSKLFGVSLSRSFSNTMSSGILCETDVFTASSALYFINIENMNFKCTADDCALIACAVNQSYFKVWCYNLAFVNLEKAGVGLTYLHMEGSFFISTKRFIILEGNINRGINDSVFINNYFSGKETTESIFSKNYYGNSRFISNYFDFWYRIFYFENFNNVGLVFDSNVVDYTVQVFKNRYDRVRVVNNIFNDIHKTAQRWTSLPEDELFAVFANGLRNNSVSIGNTISGDYYIYCSGNYPNTNSLSMGNTLRDSTEIKWNPYPNDSSDLLNTRVEEINYKTYTSLPNASLTSGSSERFNHQIAFVGNACYINNNGTWVQLSN